MKLRINGNSIRLRLRQSEVLRLATDGAVDESTAFGPSERQRFGYAVCASPEASGVSAVFADRRVVIRVPTTEIHEWATTDQVSIQAIQRTGDEGDLRILIEKDFECIHARPGESQEGAFSHQEFRRGTPR